ncbi:MAG TPA: hypothetical protein DCZ94_11225 [Lentisphaeria bacterium]|nr:MAG: hypothetical protein A2X48_07105 [Lentisphaerae bacterium GWF2_49_21]HBC87517.1 hypothetical protein [Lentisphaeria bacterium]
MNKIRFFLLAAAFLVSFAVAGGDNAPQETKKEKALKVLKVSGAAQAYVEALLEGIRQAPLTPEDKELYCKFATAESLMEYFVPVYIEKYTEEELDAMINFYSTPVGQAIVKKSLPVVRELRKASMQWGMEISAKVNSEKARIAAEKDK